MASQTLKALGPLRSVSNKRAVKAVGPPKKGILPIITSGVAIGYNGQGKISQRAEQGLWKTLGSSSKREDTSSHENLLHCQSWRSQQGSIIVMDQAQPVLPNLNYPTYWVCAGWGTVPKSLDQEKSHQT